MKRSLAFHCFLAVSLLAVSAIAETDPTTSLLDGLRDKASTAAEKASVNLHQGDLEKALNAKGLVAVGLAADLREAYLIRAGMAYSDFGKIGFYKKWLTTADGPSKELYAVLQGRNGAVWKELPAERKAFYEPLMAMMGDPVVNPKLTHAEILSFAGATATIPNTNITIPKYPMFIGYMHEWQGMLQSFMDAQEAIKTGKGPLSSVVKNIDDYRVIFETIYGHNGSGPSREEFVEWFKAKYQREPKPFEVPFWIQAHEIVKKDAATAGVPIFENSIQDKKYAGSARKSKGVKYAIYHKIADRIDGVIHPEKIFEEIAFLGPRAALIESYFGGNFHGSSNLERFTAEKEIPQLVADGFLTREDAKLLTEHAQNQVRLAKLSLLERGKRIKFYAGSKVIPAIDVQAHVGELTSIGILTPDGEKRFNFEKVDVNGKLVEKLVDASGKNEEFMPLFKEHVFKPAYQLVTADPKWHAGGETAIVGGPSLVDCRDGESALAPKKKFQ